MNIKIHVHAVYFNMEFIEVISISRGSNIFIRIHNYLQLEIKHNIVQ